MNIEMNIKEFPIIEDYSIFDSDDYVSIYDSIAKQIDNYKIAKFNVVFSNYDKIFINVDFVYDFGSIACYLEDFECFIDSKRDHFNFNFYEKQRIIKFFFVESKLNFMLINTNKVGEEVCVLKDTLDYQSFRFTILKLRNDFILLLKYFFYLKEL